MMKEMRDAGRDAGKQMEEGSRILTPLMTIDVGRILNEWLSEWNETPETATEEWSLIAFPVLADGSVALVFESEVLVYTRDPEGLFESSTLENRYRVLVYDPNSEEAVRKYRFRVYGGYAATVFFVRGSLYAAISDEGEKDYMAKRVWPGGEDADRIELGENINCIAVTEEGRIIASHEYGSKFGDEDVGTTILSFYDPDGSDEEIGSLADPETGERLDVYVTDVNLDGEERIWALLDDGATAAVFERNGDCRLVGLPFTGASALAVSDDSGCLYGAVEEGERFSLYCASVSEEGTEAPVRCLVQAPRGRIGTFDSCSFLKQFAALLADGMIYLVDLKVS